jgi:hypothetical protein
LSTNIFCLSARNRKRKIAKDLAVCSQSPARPGTSDSVRCARLVSGEKAALGKSLAAYGYNSLDCPVSQRLPAQRSAAQSAGDAWQLQRSPAGTGLSGVHRTVSGAPTSPELQRSSVPEKEGDRHRTGYSSCPVVHRTVRCTTRLKASLAFLD